VADEPVEEAWRSQSVWSQTADRLKHTLTRWRDLALALSVAGGVLANAAVLADLESLVGKLLAAVGAFAIAAAGIIRPRGSGAAVQDWTRARSVSEAIKSEVYRYLARSDEYATGDPEQRLNTALATLAVGAADHQAKAATIEPKRRSVPAVRDAATYVSERLEPQIEWYAGKAATMHRRIGRVSAAQLLIGLGGAAVAAAAAATELDSVAIWVPVVTTIAAAVTAHAAAERYEYLLVEYSRTAAELRRLKATARAEPGFVKRCEDVISTQNEGWMAKLAEPETSTS
jgi:hypothetical protein